MNNLLNYLIAMPKNSVPTSVIVPAFKWEIYKYVNVYGDEEGDVEVEDVCYDVTIKPNVPKISFMEYIDLLLLYKQRNWYKNHYVTSTISPLEVKTYPTGFWNYFDQVKGNLLYDERVKNTVAVLYFIEEFEQYAVIALHKENKKYSTYRQ